MRRRTEFAIWAGVALASLGVHAVAFGGLGAGRGDGFSKKKSRPPALVEISVSQPKPPPPPPAPAPPAPKAKLAMAHPARVKAPAAATPPPPTAAPPPAAESPADFTGVTLTNDGAGPGWGSATGNGDAMNGPVGRPGAHVTHRNVEGTGEQVVRNPGPPVVAAADLSRTPSPPDLASALERAYPPEARAKGLGGKVTMRLRIWPDGHVSQVKVLSESVLGVGFGAACVATLRGSSWLPPLDRQGRTVATDVGYTCRFEVH